VTSLTIEQESSFKQSWPSRQEECGIWQRQQEYGLVDGQKRLNKRHICYHKIITLVFFEWEKNQ